MNSMEHEQIAKAVGALSPVSQMHKDVGGLKLGMTYGEIVNSPIHHGVYKCSY